MTVEHTTRVDYRTYPELNDRPAWRVICTCGWGTVWLTSYLSIHQSQTAHLDQERTHRG